MQSLDYHRFEKIVRVCDVYDLMHIHGVYFWTEYETLPDATDAEPYIYTREEIFSLTLRSLVNLFNSKAVYVAIEKETVESETEKAMKIFDAIGVSRQNEDGTYKTPLAMFREAADKLADLIDVVQSSEESTGGESNGD